MFRVLVGRYPTAAERAQLMRRAVDGADFDDLVTQVAGIEQSVDRTIDRSMAAWLARLRWDWDRSAPGGDGLPGARVVFMHIMKTGGTALSERGAEWAGYGRSRVHLSLDDLLLMPPAGLSRLAFIGGHIPHEALAVIPGKFRTATVLREPVARAISHFVQLVRTGPPYDTLTLDEYASSDAYQAVSSNYQARQLAHRISLADAWITYSPYERLEDLGATSARLPVQSLFDSSPLSVGDAELFETARRNLAEVDFVGVNEDMTPVAAQLAGCFGASADHVPQRHVSPAYDRTQLTAPVRRRLEERNGVDRELYELAASRGAL